MIKIADKKWSNGRVVKTLDLGGISFEKAASAICNLYKCEFKNRLDGIDQAYWDIEIEGNIFTLHYEHYLGVSFYPKEENINSSVAENVLVNTKNAVIQYT
ncbi:DUF3630 family protein [Gilvimarinus agarilyticus]|uniref:DUF3630 family protein n=1 Tax=Gilvimarinus agarilyticus TaxID=679259 RepID=UPI00059F9158|nr:DUF3630 family protein [Gilvimarinus agarilyticus]